jgi:hypothetical protein
MAYIHKCFTNPDGTWDEESGGVEIELLAAVQATLRTALFGSGRTFWIKDDSDIHEDAAGVFVTSIYCSTCEKFVVSLDADSLNGRSLSDVEDALAEGEFEKDGIVWVED